jgi:hypothetical protein
VCSAGTNRTSPGAAGVGHPPGGDRVDRVLHQLADVDPGTGVQVVAQQIDDAAQIDMER